MNELSILNLMTGKSPNVAQGATSGANVATDDGFTDILNLVSDMQVVDGQSDEQSDFVGKATKALGSENMAGQVELAAMQASLAKPAVAQSLNVGRQDTVNLGETKSAASLPQEMQSLQNLADVTLLAKRGGTNTPNAEAVAQWASAIASGDVKKVSVGTGDGNTSAVAPALAVAADGLPAKAEKSQAEGAKAAPVKAAAAMPIGNFLLGKASTEGSSTNTGDKKDFKASDFRAFTKADKKAASVTGSDFLLKQNVDTRSANLKLVGAEAPVLQNAGKLGEAGDTRISSESLNFVADKIDALKANGGGQLKIELNQRELGGIEIKVGMVRGRLQVQLSADRPETLQALTASRDELTSKLKTVGAADLSFSPTKDVRGEVMTAGATKNFASAASSEDLVNVRSVTNKASAVDLSSKSSAMTTRLTGEASNAGTSDRSSSSSNGDSASRGRSDGFGRNDSAWNRGDRRDRAMNQWEELMHEEKKSA